MEAGLIIEMDVYHGVFSILKNLKKSVGPVVTSVGFLCYHLENLILAIFF
jgi:hypothetical protein